MGKEGDSCKKKLRDHYRVEGEEMVFQVLSLPADVLRDLHDLKASYQKVWHNNEDSPRKRDVTFEKVFDRLLSASSIGHLDPDVWKEFQARREARGGAPTPKRRSRPRKQKYDR